MSRIALLEHLQEPKSVKLNIPLKDGGNRRSLAIARLRDSEERTVEVELQEEAVISAESIDFRQRCSVNLEAEVGSLSMYATVEEVLGDYTLLIQASDFVPYQPKRSTFRVEAEIPVQYKRYYRESEEFKEARSEDISPGGIRIICQSDLLTGDVLTLNIQIPRPTQRDLLCTAQVMWARDTAEKERAAGCKILDMDEAMEDILIAFCFERQRELKKEKVETADR